MDSLVPLDGDEILNSSSSASVGGMNSADISSTHPGTVQSLLKTPLISPSSRVNRQRTISLGTPNMDHLGTAQRRSSSRSIKRRRFDDEIVESSLGSNLGMPGSAGKGSRGMGGAGTSSTNITSPYSATTLSPAVSSSTLASPAAASTNSMSPLQPVASPALPALPPASSSNSTPSAPERRRSAKANRRRGKPKHNMATKDLGRWKPSDDLALITGVQQTNDLRLVHRGVKFSCRFTLAEIQGRWWALLYDPAVSRVAVAAMRNLHPELIAAVCSRALYSRSEEIILARVPSSSQPNAATFQSLLEQHSTVFYPTRTAKALFTHWQLMKQYHLLPDQTVQGAQREQSASLSDAEEIIRDADLQDPRDEALNHEMHLADRTLQREVNRIEAESRQWAVAVDHVTGISPVDFDNQTLAVLRGRLVRYLMRSREISLGRSTKDLPVDVDLSLEGPAWKVSRRQGTIRLRNNGDFFLASEGKRPIMVDGRPLLTGNKTRLNNNSVIEIASLRFIFLVNQDLTAAIRQEAAQMNIQQC